jgi:hypothetical protein
MKKQMAQLLKINRKSEKGSLALEQVLFIGAVVALSVGLFVFYGRLSSYFSGITFTESPTNFGAAPAGSQNSNQN